MKNPLNLLFPKTDIAVIRLHGVIAQGSQIGGGTINDNAMAPLIERAFKSKPAAVALSINSPGGSAVQSALVAARIRRLADENSVPVHAFAEDVAASGGYWLATCADTIHADASSVVGSIGVISAGFGLQDLIARHGVERRVHTAGKSKSMLDAFRPEKKEDVERLKKLLEVIHQNFIAQVTSRRGSKLADDLFTGEVWIGQEALDKGLIDGFGHLVPVMKSLYGEKARFRVFGQKRSLFQRLGGPGAADLIAAIEDRSLWQRYGL
jgi:signal peptide peptidase SppA